MVRVAALIDAKPGQRDRILEAFRSVVETTRGEQGCVQYELHVALDDPNRLVMLEEWDSREDLDRHSAAPHIQAFRTEAGDAFARPPEVIVLEQVL